MKTKIFGLFVGLFAFFALSGSAFASTSVRLEQPQSPTNHDTFGVTFVALDTSSSQTVTVQCQKKGPSDGGFVDFGSLFSLSNGGNTGNCDVTSSVINQGTGTYQFRAIAQGTSNPTSNTVSVDFNNSSGPGTPENYKREQLNSCDYKISFHTSHDSGKTVKVALYRSTDSTFGVDAAHQVNTVNITSATDGSMTDHVADCNASYYYAIRAFDTYGNGSGVVGDNNIVTTTVNVTPTQGAIPVSSSTLGSSANEQVTGEATPTKGENKEVLGAKDQQPSPASSSTWQTLTNIAGLGWVLTHKKISLIVLVVLGVAGYLIYRAYKNQVK